MNIKNLRSPALGMDYSLFVSAILIVAGCFTASEAISAAPDVKAPHEQSFKQPNIVLIMADDLGWGDVGYHGGEIKTPAIDGLAEEGVRLNRFYTYPACTQTRGALLSGQRMRSVGLVEPMPPWTDAGLPLDISTLADQLRAANYATWKVGKWHLGDHYVEQFPTQRGFDHFYGSLGGEINYYSHVFASALDWQRNGKTLTEEGYSTHLLTAEAVRLLGEHPTDRPYFLDLSYNAPHTPLQAPEATLEEYSHIENYNRRRYAAMVAELDRGIAQVVEAIEGRDDANRTLVIFMSDNGGSLKFGASNSPLKGGKTSQYEGGLRVPAIAWWPAQLESGIRDQIMSVHDIYPTLLGLAGSTVDTNSKLPGVNVWPTITNNESISRDEPIAFALMIPGMPGTPATYSASVIQDGWKLIEVSQFNRMAQSAEEKYQLRARELYDIDKDPLEKTNLAEAEPDKLSEFVALLQGIPMGKPIGFKPPPPDWKLRLMPGAEPDLNPPTRKPVVEAARERSAN